jgi:hypothetical protein
LLASRSDGRDQPADVVVLLCRRDIEIALRIEDVALHLHRFAKLGRRLDRLSVDMPSMTKVLLASVVFSQTNLGWRRAARMRSFCPFEP